MKTQNQIKRTLSQPEAIKQINNILDANTNINRSKLADLICDQFNFFNPCGEKQRSGCLCETIFTLEAIQRKDMKDFFADYRPKLDTNTQEDENGRDPVGTPFS